MNSRNLSLVHLHLTLFRQRGRGVRQKSMPNRRLMEVPNAKPTIVFQLIQPASGANYIYEIHTVKSSRHDMQWNFISNAKIWQSSRKSRTTNGVLFHHRHNRPTNWHTSIGQIGINEEPTERATKTLNYFSQLPLAINKQTIPKLTIIQMARKCTRTTEFLVEPEKSSN